MKVAREMTVRELKNLISNWMDALEDPSLKWMQESIHDKLHEWGEELEKKIKEAK